MMAGARRKLAAQGDEVAASVDEYLGRLDAGERRVLARLRRQIKAAAPEAREVISYRIPTYLQHGPLVHFAAQPKHLSFTAVSLDALKACTKELAGFVVSGRTIHFSAKQPIPASVVKRIVSMRVVENEARGAKKAAKKPAGTRPRR